MHWEYLQVNEYGMIRGGQPTRIYLEGAVPEGWPTQLAMSMVEALNQLGAHGWELCSMFVRGEVREPDFSDTYAMLKRPRALPPPPA